VSAYLIYCLHSQPTAKYLATKIMPLNILAQGGLKHQILTHWHQAFQLKQMKITPTRFQECAREGHLRTRNLFGE